MAQNNFHTIEISEREGAFLRLLYNTSFGRCALKLLIRPSVSKLAGCILDMRVSRLFINGFVRKNAINLEPYENKPYGSFNDFFTRALKHTAFSEDKSIVFSPCDGKLTVYPIDENSIFHIKNAYYSIEALLHMDGSMFHGGTCLIFRLTPDDYHRYCFIDDGSIQKYEKISGVLHTVRPIAIGGHAVFAQNAREYILMETDNLGMFVQMEVGALFVGKIQNHKTQGEFCRGEEKGMFAFGGSTIVLLFPKDAICVDPQIENNTSKNLETIVKMGDAVAKRL